MSRALKRSYWHDYLTRRGWYLMTKRGWDQDTYRQGLFLIKVGRQTPRSISFKVSFSPGIIKGSFYEDSTWQLRTPISIRDRIVADTKFFIKSLEKPDLLPLCVGIDWASPIIEGYLKHAQGVV